MTEISMIREAKAEFKTSNKSKFKFLFRNNFRPVRCFVAQSRHEKKENAEFSRIFAELYSFSSLLLLYFI